MMTAIISNSDYRLKYSLLRLSYHLLKKQRTHFARKRNKHTKKPGPCIQAQGDSMPPIFSLPKGCASETEAGSPTRVTTGEPDPEECPIQKKAPVNRRFWISWRRDGDSNPRYAFGVYTISNRAPSASSDISPLSRMLHVCHAALEIIQ